MTLSYEKYHEKIDKKTKHFSGRFMNDTKWIKLFETLSQNKDCINKCFEKSIWDDLLREIHIPAIQDFSSTYHNKGFKDGPNQPSLFKEIEWIEFPSNWTIKREMRGQSLEPHKFEQDIVKIKSLVQSIGLFEIESDTEKLIIYGYK